MSRPLVLFLLLLVIVIGGLFYLAGRDAEQPTTTVEKVVPLDNLQQ